MTNTKSPTITGTTATAPRFPSKTPDKASSSQAPARLKTSGQQSKQDRVLTMLRHKGGTTVAAVMKVTNWQAHSIRGFFAGVVRKKLKLNLVSKETSGKRTYHIAAGGRTRSSKSKRKPTP